MSCRIALAGASLLFLFAGAPAASAGTESTFIYFDSDPGDYVGEGVIRSFQAGEGTFEGIRIDLGGVRIGFQGSEWWYLHFVGANGAPIAPGVYEDARQAFSDLTRPGLDVFGDGRACGPLHGRFVVLEAEYGPGGEVLRFAADFEQHCGFSEPALVGSVRYHSLATVTGASLRPFSVGESMNAAAQVTLSWPVPHPVTVTFSTADGSATGPADYTPTSGVLTFAPNVTSMDLAVPLRHDNVEELDEHFEVRLDAMTGGSILRTRSKVTILNDDPMYPMGLDHGTRWNRSLAFPNLNGDRYAMELPAYSSWEVVVDAVSGDIGVGNGPYLELYTTSGTFLQFSEPVGTGPAQSMRIVNTTGAALTDRRVEVRSASCTTDCGADDTYRIRSFDTTYRVARFDTTGGRQASLIVQNTTQRTVRARARIWGESGAALGEAPFTLSPRRTVVVNLNTIAASNNTSGSLTVISDAPYGALVGKAVNLDPAAGFSFDTPMLPRPH